MALPSLAQVSALAAWVGQEIPDADPRAGAVLSAASALVRAHTGETWTDADGALTDTPDAVAAIVVQVAARVWLNPAGLTSVTVDDATRRWGEAGTSGLFLTAAEKDALSDFVVSTSIGIGVLSSTRGEGRDDTVWIPTAPPPSPAFPWLSTEDLP